MKQFMYFTIGNDRLKLPSVPYRGRIAPTPTGYLHLGHARTFWIAHQRARSMGGELVYRCEDLDRQRCQPEYAEAAIEDLRWIGVDWDQGPDLGPDRSIWIQSERHRMDCYLEAWRYLKDLGLIYPCEVSRKDLAARKSDRHAPERLGGELIFPEELRSDAERECSAPGERNWRFRVDYASSILEAEDQRLGLHVFEPGGDYGDFLVWRRDGYPSYELAVV
ncbi:MAG: glutamate--tRNA ligase family protein, partial [Verrucomicrobiota bacterium]